MTQSLKLGSAGAESGPRIRRLNRVPIIVAIILVLVFLAAIFFGLSSRGLHFGDRQIDTSLSQPASNDAERLKQGVPDGIIGEPKGIPMQPTPAVERGEPTPNPFTPPDQSLQKTITPQTPALEPEVVWRARLQREQEEQMLREYHRQQMASIQAEEAAANSPTAVNLRGLDNENAMPVAASQQSVSPAGKSGSAMDLYRAALQAGIGGQNTDPNGQVGKAQFFNQDIADLGYLPNSVVPQMSPFELKRGSVIPATLVTGINSDLPGRITAQISQNVYDSATGRRLLIPQGTKLLGRYDSDVSFGQNRVLVVWTDIIFPNGSTLQIGGMAGTDAAGYGGFNDKVNNHYLKTFGSAILVALIGAGTDMLLPKDSTTTTTDSAADAARRSFAQTFGQISQQTVSKNLNVQPTLEIRPGYRFNVLVDQDIVFPKAYQ
ncbi:MAG: IncP-type conjugal transfer protein TrbI [Hoeflea sp.]|uniref:IncP-type conjugal transfer protein TrbI n=1 Tax=Hoeflea sp. TaxID=1940281 RepID=UPI001D3CA0BC|nr:IncP-type conjugal transfer protein TrbI [Hoeflea sp.]MBU4527454.1 IncP-type conjugal transfer protein TrbI [Alphaproteobacteria bacterium]MBU4543898.1 IncP-type conjugal transfer protein TrbI [Alphaproteobacteria bacterium]MBU4548840.1 IncP-type conjugal transfer protein TrbI [Alphaproteobacteria bacterium]MBV1722746.1 IncP-type conjugal transfer protein TrbI [Hoeflea sp.]MBV1785395.1 IncP-type conjugal transfer protein TrbI [Hoeflea sp.]